MASTALYPCFRVRTLGFVNADIRYAIGALWCVLFCGAADVGDVPIRLPDVTQDQDPLASTVLVLGLFAVL